MARIRTIKPEFFTSEDVVSLTPLARLFYVSLWCEADREGRMSWKPGTLKMRYLPGDQCDIHALASELVEREMLVLYEVDGKQFAEIPSFRNHQVINNREAESVIPARVNDASPRVKAEGRKEGEGREGKGKEGKELCDEPPSGSPPTEPPVVAIPLVDKSEFYIGQSLLDEWREAYPAVNVLQQLREMRQWCFANPAKRKTRVGVRSFITKWLGKEQDKGPDMGGKHPPRQSYADQQRAQLAALTGARSHQGDVIDACVTRTLD